MSGEETLTFDVIGPIKYNKDILKYLKDPSYEERTLELFIPLEEVIQSFNNQKNCQVYGTNFYQITSNIPLIVLHMGIIKITKEEDQQIISGSKVSNQFDISRQFGDCKTTKEDVNLCGQKIAGVIMLICLVNSDFSFRSSSNNDIKSKSGKPDKGIAVLYGEPVFSEPLCINQVDLPYLKCVGEFLSEKDKGWLIFGLRGEIFNAYNIYDFISYDKPPEKWVYNNFLRNSFIFDTETDRFEISRMDQHIFRVYSVSPSSPNVFKLKLDGKSIPNDHKSVIFDSINWNSIYWQNEGVKIFDRNFRIKGYFWLPKC